MIFGRPKQEIEERAKQIRAAAPNFDADFARTVMEQAKRTLCDL